MDKMRPCIDEASGSRKNPLHDNSRVINHACHGWGKGRYLPSQKQSIKQTGTGGGARKSLVSPQKNKWQGVLSDVFCYKSFATVACFRFKLFGLIYS